MYIDTEGIILKQVKTINGRRMVLLLSKKYGKISAGTSINEKGRNKTALAMHPFTYGKYEIYKNRESYNINRAEVIKSYYKIGEDVDKYMFASYILEFTEKIIPEEQAVPQTLELLTDFLQLLEKRTKEYETLVLGFQVKALALAGIMPELDKCVICGKKEVFSAISIKDGGVLCKKCSNNIDIDNKHALIFFAEFGIVNVLKYFLINPLRNLEGIALNKETGKLISIILKEYMAYYLDIGNLKSEFFFRT